MNDVNIWKKQKQHCVSSIGLEFNEMITAKGGEFLTPRSPTGVALLL